MKSIIIGTLATLATARPHWLKALTGSEATSWKKKRRGITIDLRPLACTYHKRANAPAWTRLFTQIAP